MKASRPIVEALLITVLPRLESTGASSLVAIDPETLSVLAVRQFPAKEYLFHSSLLPTDPIEHCRGIAQSGNSLYVAMFNAVRRYDVLDPRRLSLVPGELLTHEQAADLHGICFSGEKVIAASTGADTLLSWAVNGGEVTTPLARLSLQDLRFRAPVARRNGCQDWRRVLATNIHLNDVCPVGEDALAVCSLTQIWLVNGGKTRMLFADRDALLHDGLLLDDGRLLFSDASRGDLLVVDRVRGAVGRIPVEAPEAWFVRGVTVVDGIAYVLCSELGPSRQRGLGSRRRPTHVARSGRFALRVLDLESERILAQATISMPDLPAGVVAYAVKPWLRA
jgi:hypothetical protein